MITPLSRVSLKVIFPITPLYGCVPVKSSSVLYINLTSVVVKLAMPGKTVVVVTDDISSFDSLCLDLRSHVDLRSKVI